MSEETRVLPAVTMNEDLTKAIAEATSPEAIRAAVVAEATKQGLATADAAALQAAADKVVADKAAADALAATTSEFKRTETIGGREFTFEASSELELERMVSNALRVAYAVQETPATSVAEAVVDPAIAQKAAEDAAAAKAELELQFKRGDISAADYIEKSGAMEDYLAKKGVPLDALKAVVTKNQEDSESQSWADAVEAFKAGPGSDWPGGDRNLQIIGLVIASKPDLLNATDKVAALAQAYASMKSTGMVFPFEAPASAAAVVAAPAAAVVPAAAAAVVAATPVVVPKVASTSSSLFGASSGVGASSGAAAPAAAAKTDIPADATPAEIIDAWKKQQLAAGKDPNAEFVSTFAAHRA